MQGIPHPVLDITVRINDYSTVDSGEHFFWSEGWSTDGSGWLEVAAWRIWRLV